MYVKGDKVAVATFTGSLEEGTVDRVDTFIAGEKRHTQYTIIGKITNHKYELREHEVYPPLTALAASVSPKGETLKYDTGKVRHELLSPIFCNEVSKVLTYGAKKYTVTKEDGSTVDGTDNWRLGTQWRRYIGAAKRHLAAIEMGQDYDTDPKIEELGFKNILHAAQVSCNMMFLIEGLFLGIGEDDRVKVDKDTYYV